LNSFPVRGKLALITGATRGIGLGIARALGEAGVAVILVGRDEAGLHSAAEELRKTGIVSHSSTFDLLRTGEIATWFEDVCSKFGTDELLRECDRIEQIIQDQWAVIGQYDHQHKIKLVVDEYGPWYREGTEVDPSHIFGQQITIRDALATALTLDSFNRNADKVGMATCAQLINNLNALFLAHEDRFVATPNFHVFKMYAEHQGGTLIRTELSAPEVQYVRDGKPNRFWGLNGSASLKNGTVTLTLTNPNLDDSMQADIIFRGGGTARHAFGTVLTASDMHAHNCFENPDVVVPRDLPAAVNGRSVKVTVPPMAVVQLSITVA
jgi:alpha-L-arabinofuranosidase